MIKEDECIGGKDHFFQQEEFQKYGFEFQNCVFHLYGDVKQKTRDLIGPNLGEIQDDFQEFLNSQSLSNDKQHIVIFPKKNINPSIEIMKKFLKDHSISSQAFEGLTILHEGYIIDKVHHAQKGNGDTKDILSNLYDAKASFKHYTQND